MRCCFISIEMNQMLKYFGILMDLQLALMSFSVPHLTVFHFSVVVLRWSVEYIIVIDGDIKIHSRPSSYFNYLCMINYLLTGTT